MQQSKDGTYIYIDKEGPWRRIGPRLWVAPNGDTVSARSMTLELRRKLGISDDPLEANPSLEALRSVRTILDR